MKIDRSTTFIQEGMTEEALARAAKLDETGVKVSFGGLEVLVEAHVVDEVRASVRRYTPEERQDLMASVLQSLAVAHRRVKEAVEQKSAFDPREMNDYVGDLVLRHVLMS